MSVTVSATNLVKVKSHQFENETLDANDDRPEL